MRATLVQGGHAVIDKNWQEISQDPDWVRQEVARLNEAVDEFAGAMKAKLAESV
jgi:hypothetical protein